MNLRKDIRRALIVAKGVADKVTPRTPLAYGGRSKENSPVFWHGSPSGDLRGASNGLHLGTRAAAEDALNARIGFPAHGHWDGSRKYGETLLAGKKNLRARGPYLLSGHNTDAPEHDYMPHEHPKGLPDFSDKSKISPDHRPSIKAYKIVGPMTNTPSSPHDDYKANGYMSAALKRGNAKSGYYYNNQGEDSGSISAVVPSAAHIAPVDDDKIAKADGGAVDDGTDTPPPDEPIFHSALERGIAGAKQQSASPQDWKAITSKLPGVRQEEIDYSGLHDMLDQQQGQVPRDALLQHVRANPAANVQEVWKGGPHNLSRNERAERMGLQAIAPERHTSEQRERLEQLNSGRSRTKYHTYQTPGGTAYKELLLTLPQHHEPISRKDAMYAGKWGQKFRYSHSGGEGEFSGHAKEYDALRDLPQDTKFFKPKDIYKTRHWDEPNILAHVRMQDRIGPKGEKLLHIEEVQSDWHQEGRENGYIQPITGAQKARFDDLQKRWDTDRSLSVDEKRELLGLQTLAKYGDKQTVGVPDAPFKDTKDWAALAMKRVIRHAADNGYKGITWTTGDQQADRYDLSKQVSAIHVRKDDKHGRVVQINGLDHMPIYTSQIDDKGTLISDGEYKGKPLSHVVGKDVAEKIGDKEAATITGNDLKVGGEGMREFYDRILPSVVNKIAKPHGVQHDIMKIEGPHQTYSIMPPAPGSSTGAHHLFDGEGNLVDSALDRDDLVKRRDQLREAENLTLHHLPITPSMKGKSHKLFNTGGAVKIDLDHALKLARKATGGPTDVTTQAVNAVSSKPRFSIAPASHGVIKKHDPAPVTGETKPGSVTTPLLAQAFDKAIAHHMSLPEPDRILNSKRAAVKVAKYVGMRKDGTPVPLLGKNAKLMKSEAGYKGGEPVTLPDGRGIETAGLALAPAYREGKFNSCPNSASCKSECLGKTSGNYYKVGGGSNLEDFQGPRLNGLNKMIAMMRDPESFAVRLHDEISSAKREAATNGNHLGVRLNVISDINPRVHKSIIEAHPDVSFYDYTKNNTDPIAPNHHYTYSSTGLTQHAGDNGVTHTVVNEHSNWKQMRKRLDGGDNVAMAFSHKEHLPEHLHDKETGKRYKVVNGDTHDFRPLDMQAEGDPGVIVGLKNKKSPGTIDNAHAESHGFFVKYDPKAVKNPNGTFARGPSPGPGPSGKPKLGPTIPTNREVVVGHQGQGATLMTNDGKEMKS